MSDETYQGHDKITRYNWSGPDGVPGESRWIHKDLLSVDLTYQRVPETGRVLKIAASWDHVKAMSLLVSERQDGTLWVVDGGTRLLAARKRSDVTDLLCLVFHLTQAEEARYFREIGQGSKRIPMAVLHRSGILADDPISLETERILSDSGYRLGNHDSPRAMKCLGTLRRHVTIDPGAAREAFLICVQIAAGGFVPQVVLQGIFYLLTHDLVRIDHGVEIKADIRDRRYSERLVSFGSDALVAAVAKKRGLMGIGGEKVAAAGIIEALNHGLFSANRIGLKA